VPKKSAPRAAGAPELPAANASAAVPEATPTAST